MSSALFGILQLDRGEPLGYGNVPGLVQAWLQDAGGFAMLGLVVYLVYALKTPTDKSQSEKLRVPVSRWMVWMAAGATVLYALTFATFLVKDPGRGLPTKITLAGKEVVVAPPPPPPPAPGNPIITPRPTFHPELRPVLLMLAGLVALLGIGEPFARNMAKIARRNLSLSFAAVGRFGRNLGASAADALTPRRLTAVAAGVVGYALIGVLVYFLAPGLFGIWSGCLAVAAGVAVCAMLVLLLFEAEGPVWAVAKLSFKEAVRSQLLWVFLLVLLPFAFRNVLMARSKPIDEVRKLVDWTTLFLSFLVLFPGTLLAAFYGIPNDIKNLNIYTVVSKPVERFEIVLGRFLGYVALMTLALVGLTGVNLVLIANSSIPDRAREETYKARVPVRGQLEFKSRRADFEGTNVGREFDYRKYIHGHPDSPQRAVWNFATLPADMTATEGDRVPVEFTFDIYKLTKGEQNRGVMVSFRFATHAAPQRPPRIEQNEETGRWRWGNAADEDDYTKAVAALARGELIDRNLADLVRRGTAATDAERDRLRLAGRMKRLADLLKSAGVTVTETPDGVLTTAPVKADDARPNTPGWKAASAVAEEFGFFEFRGKEVLDYQVMGVEVPGGLFRNALRGDPGKATDKAGKTVPAPRLSIYVKCESPGQLLGMAEPDLYLLEYELPFALNYAKGMVGLWCWLCIVVGLAVAASTYLSGVLSFLATFVVFVVGFFGDHLNDVASNRVVGGGPFESMARLVKAEQPTAPTAETAGAKALGLGDRAAAWVFRRVVNLIPDVESFNWSQFVAEGFNIKGEYLVVNLLVMFGYLLPWGVLAYYLMKSREVAA